MARIFAVGFAGAGLTAYWLDPGATVVWIPVVLVAMHGFRFAEQGFELLIDRHPVRLSLYMDAGRHTWLEWESGTMRDRCRIRDAHESGWVRYPLELDGRRYHLRILVKSIRGGFMVSNWGENFEMVVVRNSYVF